MSTSVQQTEITSPSNTAWTQIDGTPLSGRKYVEVLNQSGYQGIGVIYQTSATAPTVAWNAGEVILQGDKGALVPAEGAVKVFVKTEGGAVGSGAGIILREWN
jgi:hypothetical protein